HGQPEVEDKRQADHDKADLGDGGQFQKLPTHGGQQVILGQLGEPGRGHQQVAENGGDTGGGEHPKGDLRQQGTEQLGVRLLRHQVVGGAHKAEQQPHDKQVGVHHAGDVEGDEFGEEVAVDVLQAHDQPEDDLPGKQRQGNY